MTDTIDELRRKILTAKTADERRRLNEEIARLSGAPMAKTTDDRMRDNTWAPGIWMNEQ